MVRSVFCVLEEKEEKTVKVIRRKKIEERNENGRIEIFDKEGRPNMVRKGKCREDRKE